MKQKIILLSTLFFALVVANPLHAQNNLEASQNYVVLTKKVPQLQPILLAAEELKKENGKNFGSFEVIICGQLIGDITDPAKIDPFIEKAERLGVTIVACGFSLNKFKVDREAVPKALKIVENGILYNLQLQQKGYLSLSL